MVDPRTLGNPVTIDFTGKPENTATVVLDERGSFSAPQYSSGGGHEVEDQMSEHLNDLRKLKMGKELDEMVERLHAYERTLQ